MTRVKLFAGIELSDAVREKCVTIVKRLRDSGLDARFEAPGKLHITVAFLGWVDSEQIEPIRFALDRAAQSSAPFEMRLDKIGAFPHERRPRVVWLGSRTQSEDFKTLARTTRSEFESLGFSFDKDALAHITLARVKGGDAHLPALDIQPVRLRVENLTLFESIPGKDMTRYEVRARYALKPRG